MQPEMETERWSAEAALAIKEVDEEVSPTEERNKQGQDVAARKDAPSMESEGGFVMCEISREQQPVRVKSTTAETKSGDTCGVS